MSGLPEGFVDVPVQMIGTTKSGRHFVRASHPASFHEAKRAIEAHTFVNAELKGRNDALVGENAKLRDAIKALADDRARVEAWESLFRFDAETFPAVGWLLRESTDAEGVRKFFVMSALGEPGENVLYRWRDAMDYQIEMTALEAKRVALVEIVDVMVVGADGQPEPVKLSRGEIEHAKRAIQPGHAGAILGLLPPPKLTEISHRDAPVDPDVRVPLKVLK